MKKLIGVQVEANITADEDIIKGIGQGLKFGGKGIAQGLKTGGIHLDEVFKGIKDTLVASLKTEIACMTAPKEKE